MRDRRGISVKVRDTDELSRKFFTEAYNVSYGWPSQNDISGGKNTYTISPINTSDKYSEGYFDCTGFVASGVSMTGDTISFLSHQDIVKLELEGISAFSRDISQTIDSLLGNIKEESFEIGVFGGSGHSSAEIRKYGRFLQLMNRIIEDVSGKSLDVLVGPNISVKGSSCSDFYFHTNKNILYAFKPQQKNLLANTSFPATEVYDILGC